MCYDINASKNALIIGLITSLILFLNSNKSKNELVNKTFKIISLFFAFVSLMQIYDWIFWLNQETNNMNYTMTKMAMITNHLQPIVFALLIYFYLGRLNPIIIFYIIVSLLYSIKAFTQINYTLVTKRSRPSLFWEWNYLEGSNIIYFVFLITLCLLSLELAYPLNYIILFINIITFFFSLYHYKTTASGRMWCYFASYIPIILFFYQSTLI